MAKKVCIVGGVAGGAGVAARVRRLDEFANIIMFEKGRDVSFSNCSLPFHLSGIVADSDDLVMMTSETFAKQYNIEARVYSEVIAINRENKTIQVKKVETGETYDETYDVLVLSPGANPIVPRSIEGATSDHVFTVRNVVDIDRIKRYLDDHQIGEVAVIGAGFIGMECMENLVKAGKTVHLIEAANQVVAPLDYDMAQILHKELLDHGVDVRLGDAVVKIDEAGVHLNSGALVPAQAVILAIGVIPETSLARQAGLDLGTTNAIKVNQHYQTSDPAIYAVGDAIEVTNRLTRAKTILTMAGPAQRQARSAADHMYGKHSNNQGVIGSSILRVFSLCSASTGLSEKACQRAGIDYDFVYVIPNDKVGLMPDANPLHFKLIFEVPTGRILGAQAIGRGAADKRIDVIASLIMKDGTLEDLKELELCYNPMFGTARDVVNHAAMVALNVLYGDFEQVKVSQVRELCESGALIFDVREPDEYELSHLKAAKNIPMSQFRDRLAEFPKDQRFYVHCRSSQRSYNVLLALKQRGYDVVNISGSFLGISYYEYFNDQTQARSPIVTDYNFD